MLLASFVARDAVLLLYVRDVGVDGPEMTQTGNGWGVGICFEYTSSTICEKNMHTEYLNAVFNCDFFWFGVLKSTILN